MIKYDWRICEKWGIIAMQDILNSDNIGTIFFAGAMMVIFIAGIISNSVKKNRNQWVTTDDFDLWKRRIKPYCSEKEFEEFFEFLKRYQGGYVRRRSGQIVFQDYLGREKGDLKGIFYNIIVPNPNIKISRKEDFRHFLKSKGVNDVVQRPLYEIRESKLRNSKTDLEEYERKEVGNAGEKCVRLKLNRLNRSKYAIINGPVLKSNDIVKEYDHIVVGETGVFCIETKAFGMTDGVASKGSLFINPEDKWIIRKNGSNREVKSPTNQILEEKQHLQSILNEYFVDVHPVLVLSNEALFVKNNINLQYAVIRIDELEEYICTYEDHISDNDRMFILQDVNAHRIN